MGQVSWFARFRGGRGGFRGEGRADGSGDAVPRLRSGGAGAGRPSIASGRPVPRQGADARAARTVPEATSAAPRSTPATPGRSCGCCWPDTRRASAPSAGGATRCIRTRRIGASDRLGLDGRVPDRPTDPEMRAWAPGSATAICCGCSSGASWTRCIEEGLVGGAGFAVDASLIHCPAGPCASEVPGGMADVDRPRARAPGRGGMRVPSTPMKHRARPAGLSSPSTVSA